MAPVRWPLVNGSNQCIGNSGPFIRQTTVCSPNKISIYTYIFKHDNEARIFAVFCNFRTRRRFEKEYSASQGPGVQKTISLNLD